MNFSVFLVYKRFSFVFGYFNQQELKFYFASQSLTFDKNYFFFFELFKKRTVNLSYRLESLIKSKISEKSQRVNQNGEKRRLCLTFESRKFLQKAAINESMQSSGVRSPDNLRISDTMIEDKYRTTCGHQIQAQVAVQLWTCIEKLLILKKGAHFDEKPINKLSQIINLLIVRTGS